MKRVWLAVTVLSLFLVGCSDDKAPMEQAGASESKAAEEPAMEKPVQSMSQDEASVEATSDDMVAADSAEGMADEANSAMSDEAATPEEAMPEEPMAEETQSSDAGSMADSGEGKKIYDSVCFACHSTGAAGAPRTGDKTAWAPRIGKGMETLVSNAVNGYQGNSGFMPAKGGRSDLSDDEVAAAVSYMVEESR